jgi:serine phosphatase RsbU (regulator of sigma subunit)
MDRSMLWRPLAVFVAIAAVLALIEELSFRRRIEGEAMALESVAAVAAAQIDGDAHETVHGPRDAEGAAFLSIRSKLREVQEHYKLRSAMYTLRPVQDERGRPATEFVVMTNLVPFVGDRYKRLPAMEPVFARGEGSLTGLYRSDTGAWVSGYAPVKASDGRAVALVEVDRPAEDLEAELQSRRLLSLLGAALATAAYLALRAAASSRLGPRGVLRRLVSGSLAVRIGLAGTLSVLVAVGIAGVLDHREARSELAAQLTEHLLSTVRVGASLLDVDLHQQVASSGDAGSAAFQRLREVLRRIQAGAGLTSPLYTLRRDGELVRFVIMTNEVPFVGDPYELRPALRRSFEEGKPGAEGPYTDAHGTWLSAWAPLLDAQGRPVAFLQADYEVGALFTALDNRSLRRALFAAVGIVVALAAAALLARSIARPVLDLARAAEAVAGGDLQAKVDIERPDEIGTLARSFNKMAHNLKAMAGALQGYAAVAESGKELELAGRLRAALVPSRPLEAPGVRASGQLEPGELGGGTSYDTLLFGQDAYLIFSMTRVQASGAEALSRLLLCKSSADALVSNFVFRPAELAAGLNRALFQADGSDAAVSYLAGVYDVGQGWLTLANAGFAYPYLLRASDQTLAQLDEESGPALRQEPQAEYKDFEVKVEPGDRLILHSPHAVRIPDGSGQMYGLERLEASIRRHAALPFDRMQTALLEDIRKHAEAGAMLQDDLAIVVVELGPGQAHGG